MKNAIVILITLLAFNTSFSQTKICTIKGDSKRKDLQHLDSLKNRQISNIVPDTISIDSFMLSGSDLNRFDVNRIICVEGIVLLVKNGGTETCECHSKKDSMKDIHVELVKELPATNKQAMICEFTKFTKSNLYSLQNIRKLVGKKVRICGYLFSDEEHKQNSVTDNPNGSDLWRFTDIEIHPCFSIEVIK